MKLIGLTGGIASGKSTIARRLEQLGAVRIDADQLAREAVAPGSPGLAAITERFGEELILNDGSLDRAALGARVFGDQESLNALNAIVHPEVRRLAAAHLKAAERADSAAILVYEVPLLVEANVQMPWDTIVVADAPAELRLERLVELRGMSRDEARTRIDSQASDEARRAVADVLIDTSGSEDHTREQVDALWQRLSSEA